MQKELSQAGITCILPLPQEPPLGWTTITSENQADMAKRIPGVYPTTLYQYLAEGVGNVTGTGAFRALFRGYIHWSSGRMNKLEINDRNPDYCFIRCQMRPSMKPGYYKVSILLKKEPAGGMASSIAHAMCDCAAG